MRLITGLILISIGAAIIYYRYRIYDLTGEWQWANTYLNNTMIAIVLIGMILVGMGAAYPFGAFDGFAGTSNLMDKTNSSK